MFIVGHGLRLFKSSERSNSWEMIQWEESRNLALCFFVGGNLLWVLVSCFLTILQLYSFQIFFLQTL